MTSTLIWHKTKINLVSGPPGSGKTTWAKKVVEQDNSYILIDDPKTKPVFKEGFNYLITDPRLCYCDVFDKVNKLYPEAHWVFFKTNSLLAWDNVQKRLQTEPYKIISQRSFLRFVKEFEENFDYFTQSVKTYQVEEIKNVLV